MSAPLGNQFNRKPPGHAADAEINLRVRRDEKARFVKAASGQKLSGWIRTTLHAEADRIGIPRDPPPDTPTA